MIGYKFPKGIEFLSIKNSPEVKAKLLELGYMCFGNLTIENYCLQYVSVTSSNVFIHSTDEYIYNDDGFHVGHLDITERFTKKYLENNTRKAFKLMRTLR